MEISPSNTVEPQWHPWTQRRGGQVPARLIDWLGDQGSLTQKVIGACSGAFRVRLLKQGWDKPLHSERLLLGLRAKVLVIVREVELQCDGRPWVYARSLIPQTSLRGSGRRLANLGEKPLGAVLFADPQVRRGQTEVAKLLPRHALYAAASVHLPRDGSALWGRRTVYYLGDAPILVNEFFLPEIP